jgi:CheY-like chemotaxis protein
MVGRMARPSHTRPVLLIDDSHEDLFLAKRLLARAGVKQPIVTVDSGTEAMVFLRAAMLPEANDLLPVVIFCDVKMPAIGGFDLVKWARSHGALAHVPIYILSGGDLDSDRQRSHEVGANGYLVKFPVPDVFRDIVDAAMEG